MLMLNQQETENEKRQKNKEQKKQNIHSRNDYGTVYERQLFYLKLEFMQTLCI